MINDKMISAEEAMTGTKCIDLIDRSRKEKLGTNKEECRRLKVRFYYSGIDEPDKEPVRLVSEDIYKQLGIDNPDLDRYYRHIKVYEDLKMKEGPFHLILFSHGYGCPAEQNSDLCSHLAENGYIVASIAHTYEASDVVFEDGTRIGYDESLTEKMHIKSLLAYLDHYLLNRQKLSPEKAWKRFDRQQHRYSPFMMERIEEWVKDDLFVLSCIHEMNEEEGSFLYHKIDFSHGVGVTGHSFGGAAAYHHCLNDDEICCGVNMDGSLYGEHDEKINHKPFMQIACRNDDSSVARALIFHDRPVHFLSFKNMTHMGFTDLKLITDDKNMVGTSDPEQTMDVLNKAQLAFFDRYLKRGEAEDASKFQLDESALSEYKVL